MYSLVIKFNLPGVHRWPDAPKKYAYLSNLHRHQFYWKICIHTDPWHANKDNRQLEIIDFQETCIKCIESNYKKFVKMCNIEILDFGSMSCEQIAKKTYDLLAEILETSGYKNLKVSQVRVLEDNENGACYQLIDRSGKG